MSDNVIRFARPSTPEDMDARARLAEGVMAELDRRSAGSNRVVDLLSAGAVGFVWFTGFLAWVFVAWVVVDALAGWFA